MKEASARRVGALDDPGDERAHHECRHRRAESKDHGIPEQSRNVPTRISLDKIIERKPARPESRVFGEGGVDERRERNNDEPNRNNNAADEQEVRRARESSQPAENRDAG